jgi:hypothetical protein
MVIPVGGLSATSVLQREEVYNGDWRPLGDLDGGGQGGLDALLSSKEVRVCGRG